MSGDAEVIMSDEAARWSELRDLLRRLGLDPREDFVGLTIRLRAGEPVVVEREQYGRRRGA